MNPEFGPGVGLDLDVDTKNFQVIYTKIQVLALAKYGWAEHG